MPFTPNDYVLDQLITLLELWKDHSMDRHSKLKDSMKTKKFVGMIRGGLTKEMLVKYWENVPAIQELIEKPNFDEIKLKIDEPEAPEELAEPTSLDDTASAETLPPDDTEPVPADTAAPTTVEPAEEPTSTGPNPKDIVATMARRRKERVMEQARRALKNRRKLL